jgi:uncharacterized membrane protein YdjX (TVP38/TMEM64 family)
VDEPATGSASARSKLLAVLGVALLMLVAWRLGAFEALRDPAAVKAALLQIGPWGYLAFVVAYAALQPFGVPGTVFVFAAPLIWPWPIAFALSMTGTMAASVIGFSFARFVARDWVARRIPARFRKYDEALERNAFWTVALLRFLLWMPQVLHCFLGISKVRFWTHFWGSVVGYFVPLLLVSFLGERIFDWMKDAPTEVWIGVGAAAVVIAVVWWLRGRKKSTTTDTTAI